MPAIARKPERFNVRATEREAELIRLGAENRGVDVTRFLVESACVRAEQMLADARHFELSPKQWRSFLAALDRPVQDKPRLKKLLRESSVLDR